MSSNYVNRDFGLKKVRPPKKYRQFMNQMGMRDVYEVPIRKTGMTGSGMKGECHDNVSKIQSVYGGKVVTGFVICRDTVIDEIRPGEVNVFRFMSHSVWMTPEGKLVDVTLGWIKDDVAHMVDGCDLDSIWFSPVVSYDSLKTYYRGVGNYILPKNYKTKGLLLETDVLGRGGWQKIHIYFSKSLNKNNHIFNLKGPYFEVIDSQSKQGGFTEPSSATGKSWAKIWDDFLVENKLYDWRADS